MAKVTSWSVRAGTEQVLFHVDLNPELHIWHNVTVDYMTLFSFTKDRKLYDIKTVKHYHSKTHDETYTDEAAEDYNYKSFISWLHSPENLTNSTVENILLEYWNEMYYKSVPEMITVMKALPPNKHDGFFVVCRLHRDDIAAAGYYPNLSDKEMESIADKVNNLVMETDFWNAVKGTCENNKLKKLPVFSYHWNKDKAKLQFFVDDLLHATISEVYSDARSRELHDELVTQWLDDHCGKR